MLLLEVLIGELLAVDGATTGALSWGKFQLALVQQRRVWKPGKRREIDSVTYVVVGEVTTLKHELGDDTVELGALVALACGVVTELSEVGGGLGDNVVVELEADATLLGWKERE